MLRAELLAQVETPASRVVRTQRHEGHPAIVMMVGVNGTGKTTTCGKLARSLVGDGETVLLGAADTFRAAAAGQLQTWGDRVGAETVRSDKEGADPASVAFEAVSKGIEAEVDVVLIDTAGRLHTKTGLMDELGKVKRVIEKQASVDEVLLVLDATTGQNGLRQARVFAEVVDVSGIVLTKLDGQGRHRHRGPAGARRPGQASRPRRGARRPGAVRPGDLHRRDHRLAARRSRATAPGLPRRPRPPGNREAKHRRNSAAACFTSLTHSD